MLIFFLFLSFIYLLNSYSSRKKDIQKYTFVHCGICFIHPKKTKTNVTKAHGPHHSPEKWHQMIMSQHWLGEETIQLYPFWELNEPYLWTLETPSHKDALCQVWLNFTQCFWRRRFLKFAIVFLVFRYYLSLKKGLTLPLWKFESPSDKITLCQVEKIIKFRQYIFGYFKSLVEIGRVVQEKKIF